MSSAFRTKKEYKFNCPFIESNTMGINHILTFYKLAKTERNKAYELNFTTCTKVEANLAALLASVIHRLRKDCNHSFFVNFASGVASVFYRNGFFSAVRGDYNDTSIDDNRESTIALRGFDISQSEDFARYLHRDFFAHRGLSDLTITVKNNLRGHFNEIFNNAFLHSEATDPVFCCGQYYPGEAQLKFTLVDLGNGFLKKINQHTKGEVKTDKDALDWAFFGTNSTRDIQMWGAGGSGLKDLKNYCDKNNGKLLILTGDSSITFIGDRIVNNRLTESFKGSIVNLTFNNLR